MRTIVQSSIVACALTLSLTASSTSRATDRLDLAGNWKVRLDSRDTHNVRGEVPDDEVAFHSVKLPGALRDSGLGDPVGPDTTWIGTVRAEVWTKPNFAPYREANHFKVPFWLQPDRHYVGPASYRREVEIPEAWRGQRILLVLERPHWRTRVSVDGHFAGNGESLATPHVFDLTQYLTPGDHTLTILVDNSLDATDVGVDSHSVTDHTQTAWNGIVGQIELRAEPRWAIDNLQVRPAEDRRSARVQVRLVNTTGKSHDDSITLRVARADQTLGAKTWPITVAAGTTTVDYTLPFERAGQSWDEFNPELYQLEATLQSDEHQTAARRVTFGIRHLRTQDGKLILNGRPIFLRGTLECCIFPLTGYPPTDIAGWKRIITICKAHGLNHIRFHSWCPPEAAFVAADELGFYYQIECSTWPNSSTALGQGRPIDAWLYREADRILSAYGNHPSFLLLAAGNEPAGPERGGRYLGPWVEHFRAKDDRRLVTSGSGWPSLPQNQFHVTPAPRIQQWGQELKSRINARPPETQTDYRSFVAQYDVPVVGHEIGQWCVFPNFDEMTKYTGTLKPKNFEIFRDLLNQAQMGDQARDFLMASGKLQVLCYKEEIESALRTPGFGGFQLLDLHDFPGQGTALVGVLDSFWDSKPYIGPEEFRRFCSATVPLVRMGKRTWMNDEKFVAEVDAAHFGPRPLDQTTPRWTISSETEVVASGVLPTQDVPTGDLAQLGCIAVPLSSIDQPTKLTLTVALDNGEANFANSWDIWVYPRRVDTTRPIGVLVVHQLTDEVVRNLEQGANVLLLADPRDVNGDIVIGFSSIFWNTAWTGGQAPHTLGVLCDPRHPALAAFPTEYHTNWQWWDLISRSKPMVLDGLPADLRPIVQVVPDWSEPQRLGLVFEAQVGVGRLVMCSIDLESDLSARPAARQMRHSLLRYMSSERFAPPHRLTAAQVRGIIVQ